MLKEKNKFTEKLTISAVQNGIFYMLFVLLPFAIIPTSWDWMERGTSLLVLLIATILIALELLKFVWNGKFSIFKNKIDIGIFLLLLSLLVSTIFSVDFGISFLGVDVSLGLGLISIIAVICLSFVMRSFIDSVSEVVKVITSFSIGILIMNIFSIFSFLELDFLRHFSAYSEVFTYGLPWTLSVVTLLILNGVVLITSIGVISWNRKKNKKLLPLNISILVTSIFTSLIFSINQGFWIIVLELILLSIMVFFAFKDIRFRKSAENQLRIWLIFPLVLLASVFLIFKIEGVKENILDSFTLLTQVSLGNDITWEIVSSALTGNLLRAVIGFGEGAFVFLYNLYKPIGAEVLSFNNTNFYFGSSEVLTQLSEGGLLWLSSWLFLGYLIIKEVVLEVKNLKKIGSSENTLMGLTTAFSSVFIYLSSFFYHFDITVKLVFFVIISLWIVSKNLAKLKIPNKFVLRMTAIDSNIKGEGIFNTNSFMTVLIVIGFLGLGGIWTKILVSDIYIASANYYISTESAKYEEGDPTFEEKENFLLEALGRYSKAESFYKENSLVNRKLSLLNLELVALYSEEYSDTVDENTKEDLAQLANKYRKEAVNHEQKSVDRNPSLYDNWKNSSNIYLGFISVGFSEYDDDALNSLANAIDLNPSNYELYYNAAQIYLLKEDTDSALSLLIQSLEINPLHVPSLLLTGEINRELGKDDVYLSYLEASKAIMEEYDQTDTYTYIDVVEKISQLTEEE